MTVGSLQARFTVDKGIEAGTNGRKTVGGDKQVILLEKPGVAMVEQERDHNQEGHYTALHHKARC